MPQEKSATPLTLILVDDDQCILDIYAAKFTVRGHTVIPCLRAEDALKKLRAGFMPDIIVSDLIMPDIDGCAFVRAIREEGLAQNVPIMILSNQDDPADMAMTKELHVTAHYIKIRSTPTETVTLVEKVVDHVRHPNEHPLPVQ